MIKEIREYYGIPQRYLAGHLGITRSHLSMAEIQHRDLKAREDQVILRLFIAIYPKNGFGKIKETEELADIQKTKLEKMVDDRLLENDYQLRLLERSLTKMKQDHLRATNIFGSLKILKANAERGDKGLVDRIERNAKELYNKTGEDSQLNLELRIQSIKAENAFLKKKK